MNDTYQLVTLTNGITSLCETSNQETFHPGIGPAAEAETLYVGQLHIAERLAESTEEFIVWDVGLGAAANAIGALRAAQGSEKKLHLVSFDCTEGALRFAIEHADSLGYLHGYKDAARTLLSDHTVTFNNGGSEVRWDFHLADFSVLIKNLPSDIPSPHAIMFDAYSPAKNPAMWTGSLFTSLYNALSPDRPCSLSTYSRSTMLRVSLLLAGFFVGSGEATGQKDETTIAANTLDLIPRPLAKQWLDRVRCSTNAEPLREDIYTKSPIASESLEKLLTHPQWKES